MGLTRPKYNNIDTSKFEIDDPITELNTSLDSANPNPTDIGFVFKRGTTGDNAALLWDRSEAEFALVTTTATGDSTGDLSFTGYSDLQCKDLIVNSIQNSTPVSATLLNSWVNYGSGFGDAKYSLDPLGVVRVSGVIKSGTVGQSMFQLPVGSRPLNTKAFVVDSAGSFTRVDVATSGDVSIQAGGNNQYVALDNITFRIDQ